MKKTFSERSIISQILLLVLCDFLMIIAICIVCSVIGVSENIIKCICKVCSFVYVCSVMIYYAQKINSKKSRLIVMTIIFALILISLLAAFLVLL